MSGTKEIKTHIQSVQETRKITSAMYLISSTKLRKGRLGMLLYIGRQPSAETVYFFQRHVLHYMAQGGGCLVITADKGLAGSYNQNAIREAMHLLEQHPDMKLFVVASMGDSSSVG